MKFKECTLQELLDESGVKQKDIAGALNLHPSTVSLKIAGKRNMGLEEAGTIAELIKTTSDQVRHAINFAKRKDSKNKLIDKHHPRQRAG